MVFKENKTEEKNINGTRETPPPFMANAIKNFHIFLTLPLIGQELLVVLVLLLSSPYAYSV